MEGITREQIIRSSILDDMEVSYIVDEYIKLVRTKFSQYKYYLSAQATVDWFGRTVRGPEKIFQYMRYDALAKYDHLISTFGSAKACEPFETKPSHFKTKAFSSENVDELVPDDVKGLVSLRVYSDRDFERNMAELGLSSLIKRPVLPPCPDLSDGDDDDDDAASVQPSTKAIDAINRDIDMESDDSNLSVEGLGRHGFFHRSNFLIAYTPLRYVEVLGQLRGYPETMKNGVPIRDDASGNHWDRPIRIRLSYRKRISDNQVEFALILYESGHGQPGEAPSNLRRNLMLEFNEISNVSASGGRTAAGDEEDDTPVELGNNDQIPTEIFHAVIASEGIDRTRIVNEIENLNVDSSALNAEIFNDASGERNGTSTASTTTTTAGAVAAPSAAATTETPTSTAGAVGLSPPATPSRRAAVASSLLDTMEGVRRLEATPPDIQRSSPTLMDTSMDDETVIGTVSTPTSDSIAEALEQAALTIVPMRTPTKSMPETPATPKRKPRNMSSLKRCNLTPTAPPPKRSAARNLRL